MKHTVESLRKSGHKVRVMHYRCYCKRPYDRQDTEFYPQTDFIHSSYIGPKGGKTIVEIMLPNMTEVKGESICSLKDAYNRKVGVEMAIGRALKGLPNY